MAMIKCPECGHDVSSNAAFCPNCGIKIANNIKFCSSCGTPMLKNVEVCPECGQRNQVNSNQSTKEQATLAHSNIIESTEPTIDDTIQQPTLSSKKKINPWLIVLIVLSAIVIIGGATYLLLPEKNNAAEQEEYQMLKDGDTNIEDYENFMTKYPNSQYKNEVLELMNTAKAWNNVESSVSKQDFIDFMNQHPQSPFELKCNIKLDSLDWIEAKQLNTPEAIQKYLEQHPNGKYTSDAQTAQATLTDAATQQEQNKVQPQENESAYSSISTFFAGLGNNDKEEICSSLAPVMNYFLKKQNATKADVINWMTKIHTNSITSTNYIVSGFSLKKTVDSNNTKIYDINCAVDNNIVRTDDGETFASYTVSAKLNSQFKIIVMKMNKISSR